MVAKGKATARKATKGAANTGTKGAKGEYRASKIYKSPRKISVNDLPQQFSRADLEFIGVDHSGASYEARIFLNNPDADENTPTTVENGFAGSFNIWGHGHCFGDLGHCDINVQRDAFDPRPSHPLQPIRKVVIATDAIKAAAAAGADIAMTVVPVLMSWTEKTENLEDAMKFDHINLVTYD